MNDLYLRSDADRGEAGLRLRSAADKLFTGGDVATDHAWPFWPPQRRRTRERDEEELVELLLLEVL